MPSNIYIAATVGATTTNYYLSGTGRTKYAGSGTPWTAQGTTPYTIAMNDVTGPRWTPQRAPSAPLWSGGPPFTSGQSLALRRYGNIQQTIPVQVYATSPDNAIFLIRQLGQLLKLSLFSLPAVLAIQPNNTTNTVFYEILDGDVEENPLFINDEAGRGVFRAQMTLTCSYAGTTNTSTPSALSAAGSVTNNGTGVSLISNPIGDLVYEGQPMNLTLGSGTVAVGTFATTQWATCYSITNSASGASFSTIAETNVTSLNFAVDTAILRRALKPRVLVRVTGGTANLQVQLRVSTSSSGLVVATSAWVTIPNTTACLVDLGTFDLEPWRGGNTAPGIPQARINIWVRSNNGASASGTIDYLDLLLYYDFCTMEITSNNIVALESFGAWSNMVIPRIWRAPRAITYTSANVLFNAGTPRGSPPRMYADCTKLYVAWSNSAGNHDKTATSTVSATYLPLFRTLRGGV